MIDTPSFKQFFIDSLKKTFEEKLKLPKIVIERNIKKVRKKMKEKEKIRRQISYLRSEYLESKGLLETKEMSEKERIFHEATDPFIPQRRIEQNLRDWKRFLFPKKPSMEGYDVSQIGIKSYWGSKEWTRRLKESQEKGKGMEEQMMKVKPKEGGTIRKMIPKGKRIDISEIIKVD